MGVAIPGTRGTGAGRIHHRSKSAQNYTGLNPAAKAHGLGTREYHSNHPGEIDGPPAVTKHLKVLERAGLITKTRQAQWRPCKLNGDGLKDAANWMEQYLKSTAGRRWT